LTLVTAGKKDSPWRNQRRMTTLEETKQEWYYTSIVTSEDVNQESQPLKIPTKNDKNVTKYLKFSTLKDTSKQN